jgi:hypothetical protein
MLQVNFGECHFWDCLKRFASHIHERVYDEPVHSSSTFGGMQLMIEFFSTLVRLFKAIVGAWRRDPQFRTLLVLVFFTLLSGTIF